MFPRCCCISADGQNFHPARAGNSNAKAVILETFSVCSWNEKLQTPCSIGKKKKNKLSISGTFCFVVVVFSFLYHYSCP